MINGSYIDQRDFGSSPRSGTGEEEREGRGDGDWRLEGDR